MAGSRYGDGAEISGSLAVTGSATFNEDSKDVDFRIESDGQTHMLFVDSGNNRVGIANDSPEAYLDIKNTTDDGATNRTMIQLYNYRADDADENDWAPTSIDFKIENVAGGVKGATARIAAVIAPVGTGHNTTEGEKSSALIFSTMDDNTLAEAMRINNEGHLGIGTTSPQVPLDIYEMGGLIIGYTMLDNGGAAGNASYTITTSYAVPTANWKTIFKAPASGKVEIQFLGYLASAAAGNNYVYLGLSDSSTYNSLGSQYEKQVFEPDEDDNIMLPCSWYLTGLTPGTVYTYYIGTKGTATGHYWYYGGTNSGENPPIIIRTMALPNTVTTD